MKLRLNFYTDPYGGTSAVSMYSNPPLPRETILSELHVCNTVCCIAFNTVKCKSQYNYYCHTIDERHVPIILKAIKEVVHDWEVLGIYLGLEQWELDEIKERNRHHHATVVYRKDMIILWLEKRRATREALITALEELGRFDVAHTVKNLPVN